MGVKGAIALSAALRANSKIRSLNLGDNWLGDQGVAAVAEVLASNSTITSLNLAENHIGLPGVRELCRRLQANGTLAEISLKGNRLDDRSAAALCEALRNTTSLTRLDLSYNHFGEASGREFGSVLAGHDYLLELNLGWNSLRGKGGAALAEGLKGNSVLNKIDIGWNGLGDVGASAVSDMLSNNVALTHLDVSHNRINLEGALSLAEGIKNNNALISLELGFNPMGMQGVRHDLTGVEAVVGALRQNQNLESVGLSNVQSGGSYSRGRASRFDPKNPDGHYVLDLAQPWDRFLAETLHERMAAEVGESWVNATLGGAPLELPTDSSSWQVPPKGVLEFDYVTWKRGLEASFRLDLSNPCDLFLAEQLVQRTGAPGGDADGESCRECRLNDQPFDPTDGPLPDKGTLLFVYISTKPQDEILFSLKLDLSVPNDKVMCLRLWERALTTPTDAWKSALLGSSPVKLASWQYPEVPGAGILQLEYSVRLAIKPYDRGVYFSTPMDGGAFKLLAETLASEALSDFDKVNLIKQAALRNYLTSHQVKSLLDVVSYRKGKLEVAVMLHPRTVDPHNFVNVLNSLNSEADRQAVLDMCTSSGKGGKARK